jgi:S-DNA-T family DNA segregation ATPase FtsK/SpoIIIE
VATTQRRAGTTRRSPPRRGPAGARRRPRPARRPGAAHLLTAARDALARHLGSQADEVWGLVLLLAGLLAALGIYADLTGPMGRALRAGTGAVLGLGRVVVPVALSTTGVLLLRGRPHREPGRVAVGFAALTVAACGLLYLARGRPGLTAPLAVQRQAGGLLGAAVGHPLASLLATWGAVLVLATCAVLSLLVLTRTSVRRAAHGVAAAAGLAARAARAAARHLAALGRLEREVDEAVARHPASADGAPSHRPASAGRPGRGAGDAGPSRTPTGTPAAPATDAPGDGRPGRPGTGPGHAEAPADHPTDHLTDHPTDPADHPALAPEPTAGVEVAPTQLAIDLGPAVAPSPWRLPPLQLLRRGRAHAIDRRLIEEGGRVLEDALAAHGVETRLVGMTVGPTVTRYELELGPGVKVARVTALHKDIAYAMASPDVRILAPIPGRSAIGVEVPNRQRQLVHLGDVLASEEARRATHPLEVGLGRDIAGRPVMLNLAEMPHLLIAGATGAGKSSCINSLITSVLMRATPEQVRMILIDPKRVELGQYNGLPHLLTQVVVNPKKAANALQWAVHEMERRYDLLAEVGVRDITGYNAAFDRGELVRDPLSLEGDGPPYARLPFVLVVVDELSDLMMVAARDVEESICRIAQMARAVGIHLVIATQRPSVDVITGLIKANVPSRLAFAVSSQTDSRVILDQPGAERLVGKGDMLLLTASSNVARRVQGSWISEEEVRKVVAHWRRQADRVDHVEIEGGDDGPGSGAAVDEDDDELLAEAMELVVRSQLGSTSMLQRKLRVGFARAGRLMDLLERKGVVGPSEGSKARAVLMTPEELDALLARRRDGA